MEREELILWLELNVTFLQLRYNIQDSVRSVLKTDFVQ